MTNEKMDTKKAYEWFVVDSRHIERSGHTFHKIKYSCVTEDIKIFEEFYLKDRKSCGALEQRIAMIGGGRKDGTDPMAFFRRGEKFHAKVQPVVNSDGSVTWMFNPFSFTRGATQENAQDNTVQETVRSLIQQKLPRSQIIEQLTRLGPQYVKKFRELEAGQT